MKEVTSIEDGTVVAIDGKTMRGTANKSAGKKAVHIVSAWCSSNKLVLGQVKTDEKSNENTARDIPEIFITNSYQYRDTFHDKQNPTTIRMLQWHF